MAAREPAARFGARLAAEAARRGALARMLGVGAAATVLAVAKEAQTAHAAALGSISGASTDQYGIIARPGAAAPVVPAGTPGGNEGTGLIGTSNTGTPAAYPASAVPLGAGVFGAASAGAGVIGTSNSLFGVYGLSQFGPGVFGGSNSSIGVYANSVSSSAVFATSPARGVWGRTTTGLGVFGQATANGGYGIYGAAPLAAGTWAGYFEGDVFVTGQVFTAGGGVLSATQSTDRSQRALYSVDSAKPIIEDVGEGRLVGGKAEVKIDPEFAAVVDGGAYQVFLTPYADLGGVYVAARTATSFTVQSPTGAGGGFGYRLVAKRKGAAGKRLQRLERPRQLSSRELEPPRLPQASPTGPRVEGGPTRR